MNGFIAWGGAQDATELPRNIPSYNRLHGLALPVAGNRLAPLRFTPLRYRTQCGLNLNGCAKVLHLVIQESLRKAKITITVDRFFLPYRQFCGTVTFCYGSGSADPYL
jgi:hypothetical protein